MTLLAYSPEQGRRPSVGLASLPPTCQWTDNGPAWGVVSTSRIVSDLGVDRGFWHTWKSRGLLPSPLPREWFKRVAGAPLYYRRDIIEGWLAARHGLPFDRIALWRRDLPPEWWAEMTDDRQVRNLAQSVALVGGYRGEATGGAPLTREGFHSYLASLARD